MGAAGRKMDYLLLPGAPVVSRKSSLLGVIRWIIAKQASPHCRDARHRDRILRQSTRPPKIQECSSRTFHGVDGGLPSRQEAKEDARYACPTWPCSMCKLSLLRTGSRLYTLHQRWCYTTYISPANRANCDRVHWDEAIDTA